MRCMLVKIERLISEIGDPKSELILLEGASRTDKIQLLRELGAKFNIALLNVGLEPGSRLVARQSTS